MVNGDDLRGEGTGKCPVVKDLNSNSQEKLSSEASISHF